MKAEPLICSLCGEEVIYNWCQDRGQVSEEAGAAVMEVILAAHRRMAHPETADQP